MIFQAYIGSSGVATLNVPFTGKYHIKLIKIDYKHIAGAATVQELIQISSQSLINVTPLSGRILFMSNANNAVFGESFEIGHDVMINGMIDFDLKTYGGGALPAGAGGYDSAIITLDFVKAN
jgi:hypothetical protein